MCVVLIGFINISFLGGTNNESAEESSKSEIGN